MPTITSFKMSAKSLPIGAIKAACFGLSLCLLLAHSPKSVAASAVDKCETKKQSSIVYMRCLDKQIAKVDEQRLLWGNNIIFALEEHKKNSGQGGALRLFKKSQKSYTKHAENNCRWQYLSLMPDPTASAIKYKQCLVQMGEKRVEELKQASK